MWSLETLKTEFKIEDYNEGEFPYCEMFLSNSFFVMRSSPTMRKLPQSLSSSFIELRQAYILQNCKCVALVSATDESSVFSYIFFMESDDVRLRPTVYFAYTKRSFRGKGLYSYLSSSVFGPMHGSKLLCSYPFPIKKDFYKRFENSPFFL